MNGLPYCDISPAHSKRRCLFLLCGLSVSVAVGLLTLMSQSYDRDLQQLLDLPIDSTRRFSSDSLLCSGNSSLLLPTRPVDWSRYNNIFFYHSRKAGGSTLRRLLKQVAQKHNVTFAFKEGNVVEEADMQQNHTLFITSLRDPIERIMSSYWFEGRWPMTFPEENKTKETAVDFSDWISSCQNKTKRWQWFSVSNTYIKWFGTTGITSNKDIVYDFDTAKERLSRFHVIVRTEKLPDDEYWDQITYILDAQDIMTKPIQRHANKGMSKPCNATSMDHVSAEQLKGLREINQLDYALMDCLFER